jgi:hypothetical protein
MMALCNAWIGGVCSHGFAQAVAPCWRGQEGTTYQEWHFDASTNPTPPDMATNPYGTAEASITVGEFGSGWLEQVPGFGSRTGYWDLGRSGTVALNIPNRPDASATAHKDIWVQVVQWHDSGIFSEYAAVSVPGATLVDTERRLLESAGVGNWMVDQTRWQLSPHHSSEMVLLTGAVNGSIIEQITLDTRSEEGFCPSNLLVRADEGLCSKSNVSWSVPPVDNCVVSNFNCTPSPGSTFPVGTTPVTCITTDAAGSTSTCTFAVRVEEPALTLTIRRLSLASNLVQICWPTSCAQPTLEWSTNVANPSSWTPVGGSVEMIGQQNCVTLEASEPTRCFRLKTS